MIEAFRLGGFGMIPTALFGLCFVAACVRYAASPERRLVPLSTSLGVMTLASGAFGCVTGLIKTYTVVGGPVSEPYRIGIVGTGESLCNLALAFGILTVGALAMSIGAFRIAGQGALETAP